jgi:hypothetical protein
MLFFPFRFVCIDVVNKRMKDFIIYSCDSNSIKTVDKFMIQLTSFFTDFSRLYADFFS